MSEWGWDSLLLGALCIFYLMYGDLPWELSALTGIILLGFWGTGGIQDSLVLHQSRREIKHIKRLFGFTFSREIYRGQEPAFLMLKTIGEYQSRIGFHWKYRAVLILRDGTFISFARPIEDPKRMQQAIAKAAHHIDVPLRIASPNEEFLPPREGHADIKSPLPTRQQNESEAFHEARYNEKMKRMMLVALALGMIAALVLTQI